VSLSHYLALTDSLEILPFKSMIRILLAFRMLYKAVFGKEECRDGLDR